ncbi:VOC family protein [Anoxynatronum buryatiense]|uniref:Glyoxalase superfamily enzyme, possibly 3-demethylubiquinone-9 3-methyltransferase n=1 Tax=Anoxynatronum buryatiense TaxID=489973 RepID=A0AA46AJM0_9CLOT|nr:Glyoxalase superfamily enzyme, possibly 3-demethylubiquinone-9 3-methyltransferase [Anoxynatronum buryatiense]
MEGINKIMTHLWFDKEAVEVGEFYLKVFENSRLLSQTKIPETPSGDVDSVTLAIEDHNLMMISAGPFFKVNPSVSFMVSCTSKAEVNRYWEAFIEGGQVMMPLDTYPFSQLYGWVEDKFGVSWQLMYVGDAPVNAKIRPSLMFVGENCGRAEEAIKYYTQMFRRAEVKAVSRYGDGFPPNKPEMLNFAEFLLEGQSFSIMDSAYDHEFNFSEGISFIVNCDTQEEIDYYWEVLSADPSAEQCGWLKDQFGVSWQIVPTAMNDMMATSDPETLQRVTKAFLQMKKFDLAELEKAYWGE